MRYAFSSNAFRGYSLPETIQILQGIGYEGIEIMCDAPHAYPPDLDEAAMGRIVEALAESGLVVSNLNAFMLCALGDFHHPSWIEPDRERREQRIRHTLDCLDLAARLGVPTISTEPGGPLPPGLSVDVALEVFVEGIQRVTERAREKGVKVLVEPEPALLIERSDQFLELMERVDREWVGLNFDIGHFYCVGEDPAEKVRELKAYIGHFHLEDIAASREHRHLQLGEGAIDLPAVLQAITEIGYQGFVTVELYPYQEEAPQAAERALRYLQGVSRDG